VLLISVAGTIVYSHNVRHFLLVHLRSTRRVRMNKLHNRRIFTITRRRLDGTLSRCVPLYRVQALVTVSWQYIFVQLARLIIHAVRIDLVLL